jgi:hypothetical protein
MRGTVSARGLGVISAAIFVFGCRPCPTCPPAMPASSCTFAVSVTGTGEPAGGGNAAVRVTAPQGCLWTFQGNAPWITVGPDADGAPNGNGNGTVVLQVAPNTDVRRTGTATVAYQTIQVDQAGTNGSTCSFEVFPPSIQAAATGGPGQFTVIPSAPDCGWSVDQSASTEDWVSGFVTMNAVGTRTLPYSIKACTAAGRPPCPTNGTLIVRDTAGQQGAALSISQQ